MRVFVLLISLCWASAAWSQPRLPVGEFSVGQMSLWQEDVISGRTDYSIQVVDGGRVLQANSRAVGSGLFRKIRVDLWQYPYLNWRWKIANRLPVRNETSKEGDDYPVRIYVVVEANPGQWPRSSLSYVWSRGVGKDKAWANAHTGRSDVMISVRDNNDDTERWYDEKRNLLQDVQRFISPEIRYVDVVGLMTDTNDTHSFANSYYGDIFLTNQ